MATRCLELCGLGLQLLVGERHHLGLERIDGLDLLGHALHITLVLASKEFFQQRRKHIDWVIRTWGIGGLPDWLAAARNGNEAGILPGNVREKSAEVILRSFAFCEPRGNAWADNFESE